jgi:hypothetical protein
MANLYTVAAIGATFRPFKNMITLFNGVGSGKIIKVWRVWLLNNQTVAVTGILTSIELRLVTSISGGGALTPTKHNSSLSSLPPQIVAAEGAICTLSSLFRRLLWSSDEPAATVSSVDELAVIPKWSTFFENSITESIIEPIVLNEGQGVSLYFNTNSAVGQADFFIEFTAD